MNLRFLILFTMVIFAISIISIGQPLSKTDSLLLPLKNSNNNYEKVLLFNSIANQLSTTKTDTAIQLCYEGLALSEKTANDSLLAVCYKCLINAYYQKPYHEDSALYFIPFFKKYAEGNNWYKLEYAGYLELFTSPKIGL